MSSCNSTTSLQTGGGPLDECRMGMRRWRCCSWLLLVGESGDVVDVVVDKDRRSENKDLGLSSIFLLKINEEIHPRWVFDLFEVSLKYNLPLHCKVVRTEEKVMLIYDRQVRMNFFTSFTVDLNSAVEKGNSIFLLLLVARMFSYRDEI